jgi:endoglucanase
MDRAWRRYARTFIDRDGRVIDPRGGDITTSEGQAYAMLQAVWADDPVTFERARLWTRMNLQGGDPTALPAWKYGRRDDGSDGILDAQPASDADLLIAYALVLAHRRWGKQHHHLQAIALLDRIWDLEVAQAGPRTVMLPGPWAHKTDPLMLNPSYFLYFTWRTFAEVDPAHPWADLIDDGYALLQSSLSPSGLFPDWCFVDWDTGEVVPAPEGEEERLVFGFEAFRVAWTLAAEVEWYGEERAHDLLIGISDLVALWQETGWIPGVIEPDGSPAVDWPYLGLYGAILPAWGVARPTDAAELYARTIAPARERRTWGTPDDYYAQNWIWFGLALWTGRAVPPEHFG